MSKRSKPAPQATASPAAEERDGEEYTSAMRIFGGIAWGTLLTLPIASTAILIPQVPRPLLWFVPPLWLGLSMVGVLLQWSVARGHCPKCGYQPLTVPAIGKRCPRCRTFLKAVNRTIVRM